jgi:hypothetical protein
VELKEYIVQYYVNGAIVVRLVKAVSFLSATIKASTNIKYRPSLSGATIRSIKTGDL